MKKKFTSLELILFYKDVTLNNVQRPYRLNGETLHTLYKEDQGQEDSQGLEKEQIYEEDPLIKTKGW